MVRSIRQAAGHAFRDSGHVARESNGFTGCFSKGCWLASGVEIQ